MSTRAPTIPYAPAPAPALAPVAAATHASARVGLIFALGAYLWWGFFPLYLKLLNAVPAHVLLAHRVVWSVLFLAILLVVTRRFAELRAALASRKTVLILLASTLAIAVNWFVYILSVQWGQVMQSSLGYFINPLINVVLGMIFLRERLRSLQLVSLLLAATGVGILIVAGRQFPWIALSVATSFGIYALLRKTVAAGPLVGLLVETTLLFPVCLAVIFLDIHKNGGVPYPTSTMLLLSLAGVITAVPLLWFAAGARRLSLATLGFLQYLAPTCQFLLAVLAFHEPFTTAHALTFGFIWVALAIYSVDSLRAYRARSQAEVLHDI